MVALLVVVALALAALRFDPGGFGWLGGVALAVVAIGGAARGAFALQRWRQRRTLDGLRRLDPVAFEQAVAGWFRRAGFDVEHRGQRGDHGIDLLATKGAEIVAVQCKRYAPEIAVRPAQVRDLYGAAAAVGATRAVLVTTGRVAAGAETWRQRLPQQAPVLELLSGAAVVRLARGR
jgi:restriction endonuclease Mrr